MLEVAGRIGGVLGTAVRHARGFSGRVRGGLQLVRGQVTNTVARASQETSGAASQFTETAREEAAGWSQAVRQKAGEFRQQARGIKTEYPLQMILGLALVSFVIGFGIRIWRSTRG
jgi:hypothetical protein